MLVGFQISTMTVLRVVLAAFAIFLSAGVRPEHQTKQWVVEESRNDPFLIAISAEPGAYKGGRLAIRQLCEHFFQTVDRDAILITGAETIEDFYTVELWAISSSRFGRGNKGTVQVANRKDLSPGMSTRGCCSGNPAPCCGCREGPNRCNWPRFSNKEGIIEPATGDEFGPKDQSREERDKRIADGVDLLIALGPFNESSATGSMFAEAGGEEGHAIELTMDTGSNSKAKAQLTAKLQEMAGKGGSLDELKP